MTEASNIPRYQNIDVVRGLAAVCVMVQHFLDGAHIQDGSRSSFHIIWMNLGLVGVVAFFLVSGFVIPLSLERNGNQAKFWVGRALRIYPLYILSLAIGIIYTESLPNLSLIAAHLLFVQRYVGIQDLVNGSWTLSLEFIWYVAFSTLYLLRLNKSMILIVGCTIIVILGGCIITEVSTRMPMGRIGMLASFVVGLLTYRWKTGNQPNRIFVVIFFIVATIMAGLYVEVGLHPSDNPGEYTFRCVIISWSTAYLLFFLSFMLRCDPRILPYKVLIFLGCISYSIYMLHGVIFAQVLRLGLDGFASLSVGVGVTILIAFTTYRWIERPIILLGHTWRPRHERVVLGA